MLPSLELKDRICCVSGRKHRSPGNMAPWNPPPSRYNPSLNRKAHRNVRALSKRWKQRLCTAVNETNVSRLHTIRYIMSYDTMQQGSIHPCSEQTPTQCSDFFESFQKERWVLYWTQEGTSLILYPPFHQALFCPHSRCCPHNQNKLHPVKIP